MAVAACFIAGCQTQDKEGNIRRHYFGLTTVTIPRNSGGSTNIFVTQASNAGLILGKEGMGIGFNRTRDILLPSPGVIFFNAPSPEQIESLKSILNKNSNLTVCIIDNSRSKP